MVHSPPIIYLDTTIFAGCADPIYKRWSLSLVEDCSSGEFRPLTSELVMAEIGMLDDEIKKVYSRFLNAKPIIEQVTEKADTLAEIYIERNILPEDLYCDALHLAIATLREADVFVTLDHPHFLHFAQGRRFLLVNLELGLKPIRLHCPRQMASYDVHCC